MRCLGICSPMLLLLMSVGCSESPSLPTQASAALENSESMVLYSLDPVPLSRRAAEAEAEAESQDADPETEDEVPPTDAGEGSERPAETDAAEPKESQEPDEPLEDFHGYGVLGKAEIIDADQKQELYQALKKSAADSDGSAAGCFNPRHGIRVMYEGKQYDFVICFECLSVSWYIDAVEQKPFLLGFDSGPSRTFNRFLKDNNLPLANAAD